MSKILDAFDLGFLTSAEKAGREMAEQLCQIAQSWGNKKASTWRLDIDFVRFLGVITVNQ
jgi:hypothetical protein